MGGSECIMKQWNHRLEANFINLLFKISTFFLGEKG
jgi:hypothetical protein